MQTRFFARKKPEGKKKEPKKCKPDVEINCSKRNYIKKKNKKIKNF